MKKDEGEQDPADRVAGLPPGDDHADAELAQL